MTITQERYDRIAHLFPTQRGNVKISNLDMLNAFLYVAEHGCKMAGTAHRGSVSGTPSISG